MSLILAIIFIIAACKKAKNIKLIEADELVDDFILMDDLEGR